MSTLNKALLRKVEWPSQTSTMLHSSQVDPEMNQIEQFIIMLVNTSRPFCLHVLFSQLAIFMMMILLTTTTKLLMMWSFTLIPVYFK